jgi:probable F420-dependent oxidoreductase
MDPRMPLGDVAAHARRIEALGYDGLHVAETIHDPFMVSLLALNATSTLRVRTAVALAFIRSPMITALSSWDLSVVSAGRFELGLGSQIKQNIEDRYGAVWSEPVERMADYVEAVRACFTSFQTGAPLTVTGTHYPLRRLQAYFNPGPNPDVAQPPIYLGGVNEKMTELAGRVADGFITHPTNSSPRAVTTHCLPNLERGREASGRSPEQFELVVGTQVITGATDALLSDERERQRKLFAFLYSTPAYARTLELYGYDHLVGQLQHLVRSDDWSTLNRVVTNDILDALIPTGHIAELGDLLIERFGAFADGLTLSVPTDPSLDEGLRSTIAQLQAAS